MKTTQPSITSPSTKPAPKTAPDRPAAPAKEPTGVPCHAEDAERAGGTRYDGELAALICERIATNPQSMACICKASDMPAVATLFRWLRDHEDFREMYVLAKQAQAELLIDEALEIVDDSSQDLLVDDEGRTVVNRAALQRSRMRVAFRQWIASKLLPRKYGNTRCVPPSPPPAPPEPEPAQSSTPETGHVLTIEEQRAMQERRRKYLEALQKKMKQAEAATLEQQQQSASTPPGGLGAGGGR